ncbi:MAG: hypothetical protein K940chlam3_01551 [Chlamydiae bacterium]|nr:hypothetical protein [Chlamydiota bacterium]
MEVSNENFLSLFREGMTSDCTRDEKRDFLALMFEKLVVSPSVKDHYAKKLNFKASELVPPSDKSIRLVADQTYNMLFYSDIEPSDWEFDFIDMNLDIGIMSLVNRELNGRCIVENLIAPTADTAVSVYTLINEGAGADISSYNLYRLAFEHQCSHTVNIVQTFLDSRRLPSLSNLHRLLVIDSDFTLDILELFLLYKVTFPSSCLTYALKYFGARHQLKLLTFILEQEVIPDQHHIHFARRHCAKPCVWMLEDAYREYHGTAVEDMSLEDLISLESQPSRSKIPSIERTLRNQTKISVYHCLRHIRNGKEITSEHMDLLFKNLSRYTFELFRLFLICGIKLSDQKLKGMSDRDFPDFEKIIKLHLLYGFQINQEVMNHILKNNEGKFDPDDVDPVLLAFDTMELILDRKTPIQQVVSEYMDRAPGIYELLIRSGVHPSLDLLNVYCTNRTSFFIKLIDDEEDFEVNPRNQQLLTIAIETSTGEIVRELVKKGFNVTPIEALMSIFYQLEETVNFLIKKMLKSYTEGSSMDSSSKDASFMPKTIECIDENDLISLTLSQPNTETKKDLRRLLESGEEVSSKHFDMLRRNISIFTPELIQLIEKRGWSY